MTSDNEFTQKVSFPRLYKSGESLIGQQSTISFNVGSSYKLLETIGTGAYGVVCSAIDEKTGKHVAIKKIVNAFDVLTAAKRTLRELKLLLHFKHDNVVGIKNIIQNNTDKNTAKDVYFVMDLLRTDLHHLIRSDQPLTAEHIRYFSYQILRGLKYIHSAGVVHRDLKPSNLLINENCDLKIGDFGMARGISMQPEQSKHFMTEYVTTRWYRAPELMLSVGQYNQAIDIWSVGCIFAEMIGRKQLFPGKDYVQQLQLIISVLGSPNKKLVDAIRSERVRNYVTSLPHKSPTPLQVLYPKASEVMLSFLHSFLQFDPSERPPAEMALSHPFFNTYHNINDEPVCPQPFDFCFESKVTCQEVKEQVMDIINNYHQRKARFLKQLILVRKPTTSTPQVILNDKTTSKFNAAEASGDTNKTRVGKIGGGDQLIQGRTPAENNVNTFRVPTTNEADTSTAKPATISKSTSDDGKPAPLVKNSAKNNTIDSDKIDLTNDDDDDKTNNTQPMITVQVDFFPSQFPETATKSSSESTKSNRVTKSTKTRSSASSGAACTDKNLSSSNSGTRKGGANPKITISEETKMKIRDAIFASMLAKQKGLGKPLDKIRKPVTAADRQKEREEKRRKRQEKLQEKEKRRKKLEVKNGEGSKPKLSNEDKDLLERWTKMQQTKNHNRQESQNNSSKATEVADDTGRNQTSDSVMKAQKVVGSVMVKQPVVLILNNKERQQAIKEKDKSSTKFISKPTFSVHSGLSNSEISQEMSKAKNSKSSTPCRPVSLFNLPLQTSRPPTSSGHQLTPGTLLEISGGNTNKNLTTLSPDTIESVFASDALLSNMKTKPKATSSTKSYDISNAPAIERRDHQVPPANKVSALNKNVDLLPFPTLTEPSKSMALPSYHTTTTATSTTIGSDFSPSDFLRSPHFSTVQKPELNSTDCNPLLAHLPSPAQMMTSSGGNAASGYGLGACMDVESSSASQTLNHAVYPHADAVQQEHQQQQRHSEGSGGTSQLGSDDLLADWLDMNNYLQPLEMEALQRELELGSPMSVDDFL